MPPAHMRPPEPRSARPFGALAVAVGIALVVVTGFSGRAGHDGDTRLVAPATDASTEASVLGEVIERSTTVPDAPPASATGFTTTSEAPPGAPARPAPPATPSPTLAPPVSVTRPPRPTTTTTTAPSTTSSTTTTTEPTTTTESTTTTDTTVP